MDQPGHRFQDPTSPCAYLQEAFTETDIITDEGLAVRVVNAIHCYPLKIDGVVTVSDVHDFLQSHTLARYQYCLQRARRHISLLAIKAARDYLRRSEAMKALSCQAQMSWNRTSRREINHSVSRLLSGQFGAHSLSFGMAWMDWSRRCQDLPSRDIQVQSFSREQLFAYTGEIGGRMCITTIQICV